jgi:hypothetical protein
MSTPNNTWLYLAEMIKKIKDPDREKRELAQKLIMEDPERFQKLVDSPISQNPEALKSLFGQDPRWGFGRGDSSGMISAIQKAPLSDVAKAKQLEKLDTARVGDISNASISMPEMRAFNGMSNPQFAQSIPPQLAEILAGKKENMLPQQLKDVLAKSRGLPTDLERKQVDTSIAHTEALTRGTEVNTQNARLETETRKVPIISDETVDNYLKLNPALNKKSMYEIYTSPSTPQEVRNAIPSGDKYGKAFKADFEKVQNDELNKYRKDEQDIQKSRLQHDKSMMDRTIRLQAGAAWKDLDFAGGEKGFKGLQDIYSGNLQTPEALNISKELNNKSRKKLTDDYNLRLAKVFSLQKDVEAGKISPDALQIAVDEANAAGNALGAVGIKKDKIIYGDETRKNQSIPEKYFPFVSPDKTIHTVSGGVPSAAVDDADIQADQILNLISSDADFVATMADPSGDPNVKAALAKKWAERKKGKK